MFRRTTLLFALVLSVFLCGVAPRIAYARDLFAVDLSRPDKPVDWAGMQEVGVELVVVQARGNKTNNPQAERLLREARSAGFKTAAYVFLDFDSEAWDGGAQASFAMVNCGLEVGDLSFMAIDVEVVPGRSYPTDQAAIQRRIGIIRDAIKSVRNVGLRPIIYAKDIHEFPDQRHWSIITGTGAKDSGTREFSDLLLWTARYDAKPELDKDNGAPWQPFGGWFKRQGKQYYEDKNAELFGVPVDLNIFDSSVLGESP